MGKVRSPTRSTAAPSTKRSVDTIDTGPPAARAAVMLGAPAGSTPTRRVVGEWARNQVAMPASSPPPPDGDDERAHWFRQLAGDLHGHGALAGDGAAVVEGVDVDGAGGRRVRLGRGAGLVEGVADHDRLDQVAADGLDLLTLLAGGGGGQEHPGPDPEELAAVGDPEGVVAGAGADDTEGPLRVGQRRDEREGAAELVGPADLLVLALEPHGPAQCGTEAGRLVQRGGGDDRGQPPGRGGDVVGVDGVAHRSRPATRWVRGQLTSTSGRGNPSASHSA